jgi:hypothetical protein
LYGNGEIEKIELKFIKHNLYLCVDSAKLNLYSDEINVLGDENGTFHGLFFSDIDNDGIKEIFVVTGDPDFSDRSILRIFKYNNNAWDSLKFNQGSHDDYYGVISSDKLNIFNSKSKKLYVLTGHDFSGAKPVYDVDLYKWDAKIGKMILAGQKSYHKIDLTNISKILF